MFALKFLSILNKQSYQKIGSRCEVDKYVVQRWIERECVPIQYRSILAEFFEVEEKYINKSLDENMQTLLYFQKCIKAEEKKDTGKVFYEFSCPNQTHENLTKCIYQIYSNICNEDKSVSKKCEKIIPKISLLSTITDIISNPSNDLVKINEEIRQTYLVGSRIVGENIDDDLSM